MKRFLVFSLLLHLAVLLPFYFFDGRVRWEGGSIFSAEIVTPDEVKTPGKGSDVKTSRNPGAFSQETGVPHQRGNSGPASIPAAATKQVSSSTLSRAEGSEDNSLRGPFTRPATGSAARICDDFKASIPVFLCNARIYFGR
jgi:hypothetical protein